jgi:hypothetical protein
MIWVSFAQFGTRINGLYAHLLHGAAHGIACNRAKLGHQQGLDFPRAIERTISKERVNAVLARNFAR